MDKYTLKAGRNDRFFTKAVDMKTKKVFYLAVPETLTCQDETIYVYKAKSADLWFADTEAETFIFTSENEVEAFRERFFRGEI